MQPANPVNPQPVVWEPSRAPDNTIGHVKTWRGPALATFAHFLFMAHHDNS